MPTDTTVKFFTSDMSGAPTLPNSAGALIAVLDACLVNGFGSVTLDSLVISGNVATGTKSTGHGFAMTGATGPVIRIAGATPSGLNGDWRIQTVPSSTTFTFMTSGISDQTATGTITAKRAPAGFEKVFSGTNKAVYRSLDIQGTRAYLRVDDSTSSTPAYPEVTMYASMSDVDTGVDGYTRWVLRRFASVYNSNWRVYADSCAFYWLAETYDSNADRFGQGQLFFGDLAFPAVAADGGRCALNALSYQTASSSPMTTNALSRLDEDTAGTIALSYNGATKNVAMRRRAHMANVTYIGNGGGSYVAEIGLLVHAIEAWEGGSYYRGLMPGWYGQVHANLSNWWGGYYEHAQIGTLRGDSIARGNTSGTNAYQFFDITGPWR